MITHPIRPLLEAINSLPENLFAPEVVLEEDGDICFDWQEASDCVLSISLSAGGRVGWSALIKDYKSSGHGFLPELPDGLKEAIRKYDHYRNR